MTKPYILRKSNHPRHDGWTYPNDWVLVENVCRLSRNSPGRYLYLVDGIEYDSRSPEWKEKLSELQTWSRLTNE